MGTVISGDTGKGTDLPSGDTTAIQLDDGNLVVLAFKDPQLVAAPYGGGDVLGKGLIRFLDPNTGATTKPDIILGTGKTIVNGIEKTPDNGFIVYGQAKESLYGRQFGGATDAFVIKYKSDGTFQWIQSFNTSLHESIASASIDPSGRILVSGRTSYDLSEPRVFGSQSWYGQALGGRYYAAFTSSISAQGSVDWVNVYGGLSGGIGIAADKNGYISSIYTGVNSTPTNYSYFDYGNNLKWSKDVNVNDYAAAIDVFYGQGIISIVSGSNQVSLVNDSGTLLKTITAPNGGTVHDIEVKGDNLFLLSRSGASSNLEVSVYDKNGLQKGVSVSIPGSAEFVDKYYFEYDLEILADGKYLISGNTGDAGFAGAVVGDYREYILFDPNPKPIIRGNSIYTIVQGPSWTEAEANSVKLGGHLSAITSKEENEFLFDSFIKGTRNYYWIGFTDEVAEGDWKWANGDVVDYTNWYPGMPDDDQRVGGQDYAKIGWYTPYQWDDTSDVPSNGETDLKGGIAETPFIRRGDSAYVIVQGPTWEEAEANAVKLGGHLVTINDAAENEWVFSTVAKGIADGIWLGGTDKDQEGTWKWADGTLWGFTNWNQGQPDNATNLDSKGEDYLQYVPEWSKYGNGGKWNDITHNYTQYPHRTSTGIAEIKLAPNNNPSGTPTLSGTLKAGQVVTIDKTPIQDADNFTGYTPDFKYSWEISTNGTTWTPLTTTDATDNNTTYTITTAEVGKQVRGVVSYLDGYGTQESVASTGSSVTSATVVRGNSLYTIVDGPSWTQAEANSVKLGGHLVTINDASENSFVTSSLSNQISDLAFIGNNDIVTEGMWRLPSGELQTYANWANGEPNDGNSTKNEDVAAIYFRTQDFGTVGVWNDVRIDGYGNISKGIAETPFIRRGDSAYVIVQGPTWEEAEANAVALGGHLVTINDAEENDFLSRKLLSIHAEELWIGITRGDASSPWEWIGGDESSYTSWNWQYGGATDEAWRNYGMIRYFDGGRDPRGHGQGDWDNNDGEGYLTSVNRVDGGIAEIKLAPNNTPTGTPTLSGTTKVGQVITIDRTPIQDADNFEGWTPTYKYTWEVANDPGLTQVMPIWESLTTADATDGDENLEITDDLTGKLIRGVVSYVDGYGTNETVYSSEAKVEASVPTQRLISLPTDLTAKVGQIIEVPININQAQDLQALDLNFAFDPELFSAPTAGGLVRAGSLTSSWTFTGNVNTSTNTLKVSGFSSESLSAVSGDLAYLRLQVKGTAPRGETVLDLINASLNENELSGELQDGSLTITAPKVSITSDLKAPVGGSIGIPITIDDASDLQSIDLVFAYDPTIFSLPASGEIVSGSDLTGDWSFAANTATPGQIRISGFGTTPLEGGEGGLVNLNLKINSGVDTGNVLLDLVSASFNEGGITADLIDGTLELLPPTFQVLDVRQTASGLALKLSEAPDLEKLNLYDGQDASIDLPDLRLTRSDGSAVEDLSLHWKEETSELYVIHTDSLTGISQNQFAAGASPFQSDLLAAGDYTLVIDARSDGLVSASSGELIDGNGDGITGDAFSYAFTKSTPSNLISIADTARGSGQSLGLNGIAQSNGINGLPVLISTSAAIRSLRGTVNYDATAFNNASLVVGRDLPDDWTLETQEDVIGSLNYTASGTTAITGTDQELFRFDAVVSQDATYGASTLIEATVEAPEDPTLTFESDPSLVALAYSGDTTGNGGLSSLDASRIQRVVVGLDSGFDPYDTLAPTLIGDTTGNGGLSSLDASRVQQQVVGLPVDSFPLIPDPVPVI